MNAWQQQSADDVAVPDKLRTLTAYTSADVYDIIEDCAIGMASLLGKLKGCT